MARRGNREERRDTEASTKPFRDDCPFCTKNEASNTCEGAWKRHAHYLYLARQDGLEGLKAHLTVYLHRWYSDDPDQARQVIHSIIAYVRQEVSDFSGEHAKADPVTGAPLPWDQARQHTRAMFARNARSQIPRLEGQSLSEVAR